MESFNIEVKKIGRSHCVVAGEAILGKFKTAFEACESLVNDAVLYKYWAGSSGVSIQNTPAIIK